MSETQSSRISRLNLVHAEMSDAEGLAAVIRRLSTAKALQETMEVVISIGVLAIASVFQRGDAPTLAGALSQAIAAGAAGWRLLRSLLAFARSVAGVCCKRSWT